MNTEFYFQFCIDEIRYHVGKITEILSEGLRDPRAYYERQMEEPQVATIEEDEDDGEEVSSYYDGVD